MLTRINLIDRLTSLFRYGSGFWHSTSVVFIPFKPRDINWDLFTRVNFRVYHIILLNGSLWVS